MTSDALFDSFSLIPYYHTAMCTTDVFGMFGTKSRMICVSDYSCCTPLFIIGNDNPDDDIEFVIIAMITITLIFINEIDEHVYVNVITCRMTNHMFSDVKTV